MAMQQHGTVVGVFRDHDHAREAIRALKDAGFTDNEIGVAGSRPEGWIETQREDTDDDTFAGEGALAGLAGGAGIGALWGLGILAGALPAIGPAIAGGTLAVILSSAAVGAAAAGLAGALIGMGFSKEEAEYYEGEMKAGRMVVTVHAGSRRQEAMDILRQHGAYDMTTRQDAVEGQAAAPYAPEAMAPLPASPSEPSASILKDQTPEPSDVGALGTPPVTPQGQDVGSRGPDVGPTVRAYEDEFGAPEPRAPADEVVVAKEAPPEHQTFDVPVTREEVGAEQRPRSEGETAASQPANEPEKERPVYVAVVEEHVFVEKQPVGAEEASGGQREVQGKQHLDETARKENEQAATPGDANVRNECK